MTIPVSTAPRAVRAIYAAVLDQVAEDAGRQTLLVCVGDTSGTLPNDVIQIATGIRRTVQAAAFVGSGGAGALEEHYTITAKVSVAQETVTPGTQALTVSDRAWQLVAYLEQAVRTDPSLGTVVTEAFPASATGGSPTWSATGKGRLYTITVIINCIALI